MPLYLERKRLNQNDQAAAEARTSTLVDDIKQQYQTALNPVSTQQESEPQSPWQLPSPESLGVSNAPSSIMQAIGGFPQQARQVVADMTPQWALPSLESLGVSQRPAASAVSSEDAGTGAPGGPTAPSAAPAEVPPGVRSERTPAAPTGYAPSTGTGSPNVERWSSIISEAARAENVPEWAIKGLMEIESGGNPEAVSSAGAQSLMQVMPFHFKPGENPKDPRTNIFRGAKVYGDALRRYGDPDKAAAAYFGAIDANGNVTSATDGSSVDGHEYVRLFRQAASKYGGTPKTDAASPQVASAAPAAPPTTGSPSPPAAAGGSGGGDDMVTIRSNTGGTLQVRRSQVGEGPGQYSSDPKRGGYQIVSDGQPDMLRQSLSDTGGQGGTMQRMALSDAQPMPEDASESDRNFTGPWPDREGAKPRPYQNIVPYDPVTHQTGELPDTPAWYMGDMQRQPLAEPSDASLEDGQDVSRDPRRFIPTPNIVRLQPALAGQDTLNDENNATADRQTRPPGDVWGPHVDEAPALPYLPPGTRNRAVPYQSGELDEVNYPSPPSSTVYGPFDPAERNRPVRATDAESYETGGQRAIPRYPNIISDQVSYRQPLYPTDPEASTGEYVDPDNGPRELGYTLPGGEESGNVPGSAGSAPALGSGIPPVPTPRVTYGDAGDEPQVPYTPPMQGPPLSEAGPEQPSAIQAVQNARAGMADQEELAPRESALKPLYDLGGQIIGYVQAGTQAAVDALPEATRKGIAAGTEAYSDPLTSTMPGLARGVAIYQAAQGAFGDEVGRRVGEAVGLSDEDMGLGVSPRDVAGFAGQMILDPTNLISAGPVRHAAADAAEAAGPAIQRGARALGTRVSDALERNAERVATADARMAAEGSIAAPVVLGAVPEHVYSPTPAEGTTRRYHGTASAFDAADPARFDENGLYGPGYYTTSDPRVASSYADQRSVLPGGITPKSQVRANRLSQEIAQAERELARPNLLAEDRTFYEGQLERARADLERVTREGPNVRAVDIPPDVKMLDVDAPLDPALVDRVEQIVSNAVPEVKPELMDAVQSAREKLARSQSSTGFGAWYEVPADWFVRELMDASERIPGMGKGLATEILSRAGFDGIAHKGGQRVPMMDSAGNPIEHDISIIFPRSINKVRNAFSGTYGGAGAGILPEIEPVRSPDRLAAVNRALGQGVASAVSGGVGAQINQQMNPDDPNAAIKGFAVGALAPVAAVRGAGALARRFGKDAEGLSDAALATLGNVPNNGQGNQIGRNVARAAQNSKPANLLEIVQSYRNSVGLLGNPIGTGLINAIGGPVSAGAGLATDAVRTGLMKGYPIPAIMEAGSLVSGLAEASRSFLGTALGFIPQRVRNAPDFRPPLSERMGDGLGKVAGYAIETPGRLATQAPDAFFNTLFERWGRRRAANEIMMENGISRLDPAAQVAEIERLLNNPTADEAQRIAEGAKKFADEMTYKGEAGPVEKALGMPFRPNGGKPTTANDPISTQVMDLAGSLVMPFYHALFQIQKQAATHTPGLGFIADTSKPMSERIARQAVGAGFGLWAADRASQGLVTGPGPDDPDEKKRLEATGWQEWSTFVPGIGFVKSDNFAQAGPMLKMIGAYYDAKRYKPANETDDLKEGNRIAKNVMKSFESFPVVQAVEALYKMAESPVEGGADFATSVGSSFVPALVRANEASKDEYSRTVDRNAPLGEQIRQRAANRLGYFPGIGSRQDSPPALDRKGEPIPNPRAGIGAFIPQARVQKEEDPIIAEMGQYGVNLDRPRDRFAFTRDGKDAPDGVQGSVRVMLNPDQQQQWLRARWQKLQEGASALQANPEYQRAPDAIRKKAWQTVLSNAETFADRTVKISIGEPELRRMIQEAPSAAPVRRAS